MWKLRGCLLGALALSMASCTADDAQDTTDQQDDGALYSADNRLAVPLASLPADVIKAAQNHLHMVAAGVTGGEAWRGAELAPFAVPLQRPDVQGPAYYELKIVRGADSLGFMVVSTGRHDVPVPEFKTTGATKAEQLVASTAGNVHALYRLDSSTFVAEDARGEIVEASSPQIPIAPTGPDGRTGLVAMGPWTGWQTLKHDFARGFARDIESLRVQSAGQWDALRALPAPTVLDPNVTARTWTDVYDQGATTYECENNLAGPNSGTTNVNDLTPKWNQLYSGFRHLVSNDPNALCASGCTPTAAAEILGWMDRQSRASDSGVWSRPEMGRAFFRYKQAIAINNLPFVDYGYRAPYVPLYAGAIVQPPVAVYDYSAEPKDTWVADEAEANVMNESQDMRRLLTELSMAMRTYCNGFTGSTQWGPIAGLQRFFDDHRIPVNVSTGSNPFGEPAFRDNIINSLRSTGAPGFIHTGDWNGHTEVVNAHSQCRIRDKATGQITWTGYNYFYTNKGWGNGNFDGWIAVGNLMSSTTFTPKSPWVKLQTRYSMKCADVPGGAVVPGMQLQQYTCNGGPNQRWIFQPNSDGTYMVRNLATQMCLDVSYASTANNAAVGQYYCVNSSNQRWRAEIRPDGKWLLRSQASSKCLEAINFATNDGAPLGQYTCDGAASQVWDLVQ
jgi:hypothetical protein